MPPKKISKILLALWLILVGLGFDLAFPGTGSLNNILALLAGILLLLGR